MAAFYGGCPGLAQLAPSFEEADRDPTEVRLVVLGGWAAQVLLGGVLFSRRFVEMLFAGGVAYLCGAAFMDLIGWPEIFARHRPGVAFWWDALSLIMIAGFGLALELRSRERSPN